MATTPSEPVPSAVPTPATTATAAEPSAPTDASSTVADAGSTAADGADARPTRRGTYVVPGLLVVALVLLLVGLVTGTSGWLAASLAASVLAAVLLVVERLLQRRRPAPAAAAGTGEPNPASTGEPAGADSDVPVIDPDDPEAVWVVDGRPRYHVRTCETLRSLPAEPIPRTQALEDGFVACSLCEPGVTAGAQHSR